MPKIRARYAFKLGHANFPTRISCRINSPLSRKLHFLHFNSLSIVNPTNMQWVAAIFNVFKNYPGAYLGKAERLKMQVNNWAALHENKMTFQGPGCTLNQSCLQWEKKMQTYFCKLKRRNLINTTCPQSYMVVNLHAWV